MEEKSIASKQEHVTVLMSTYNGEKYLEEQLESIIHQESVEVQIYIRDDGSTDGTKSILEKYGKIYPNVLRWSAGENIGYMKSFDRLLRSVERNDYVAFADQDDVWFKDKLAHAISKLKKHGVGMYCGNAIAVTSTLKRIGLFIKNEKRMIPPFKLLTSGALGCTIVMNWEMVEILRKYEPTISYPHDYWCTCVALYCGGLFFDKKPYMYYRQHEANVTGGIRKKSIAKKVASYTARYFSNAWSGMAQELFAGYRDLLNDRDKKYLELMINSRTSLLTRVKLLVDKNCKKDSVLSTFFFKVALLFGCA